MTKKVNESKSERIIKRFTSGTKRKREERKDLYSQMEKLLDKVGHTTNIQSNINNYKFKLLWK